jgi:hypothetical protein
LGWKLFIGLGDVEASPSWSVVETRGIRNLTLSTAEAGRFLHTAPSTLGDTYVSAFIPSWFRSYLQGLCHQPVNGFFRLEEALYLMLEPPRLSRLGALFEPLDIQATSNELMED